MEEEGLFTAEDFVLPKESSTAVYPTLQGISTMIDGIPATNEPIDFQTKLDSVWQQVNKDNILLNYEAMNNSVATKNIDTASMYAADIRNRLQNDAAPKVAERKKLEDIATAVAEQYASSRPNLVVNNDPVRVAYAVDKASSALTTVLSFEKKMQDAHSIAGWGKMLWGALLPYYNTLGNLKISELRQKYTGDGPVTADYSEDILALTAYYNSKGNIDDKIAFLNSLWDDLTASKYIPDLQAAIILNSVMTNEEPGVFDIISDKLNKAQPILDTLGLGIAFTAAAKGLKAAKAINSAERALALAGGKDVLITADALKIGAKAVAEPIKEVTGISAVEAIARLTTSSVKNILPTGISTAPSQLQAKIISNVEKTIKDLEETLTAEKAVSDVEAIKQAYNPAVNHSVARLDFEGEQVRVWFKPEDSSVTNFTTKEAAEGFMKIHDPDGKLGLKVVPDTTNPGFLVTAERRKEIETALALKRAELALLEEKAKSKATKKVKVAVETPVVRGIDEEVKSIFKNNEFVKLPNLATDNDVVLYKAEGMTHWVTDAAQARKWAQENKVGLRSIAIGNKELSGTAIVNDSNGIRFVSETPPVAKGAGATPQVAEWFYSSPYLKDAIEIPNTNGNVKASTTLPNYAVEFISKLHDKLFTGGRGLLIINESDIGKLKGNVPDASNSRYTKEHGSAWGYYVPVSKEGHSVIVIRRNPETKTHYLSTLAHEYAHYFEDTWSFKYAKSLEHFFIKWADSKGYSTSELDEVNLVDLAEYRSITTIQTAIGATKTGDPRFILPYAEDSKMLAWMQRYDEFFAEQFSKWAFSDEVPTTLLGQLFSDVVEKVKNIFRIAANLFGKEFTPVNEDIAKLLNNHIKTLRENSEVAPGYMLPVGEVSYARRSRAERLLDEINELSEELRAIDDASTGVVGGWLVELNATARLPKYRPEDISSIIRVNLGDWALGTSNEQYVDRLVGTFHSGRYRKILTDFVRKPLEALSKKEKATVESALMRGDALGKEFTPAELLGEGMNEKEVYAYEIFRAARNFTYRIRNDALSKSLESWGYKTISHPLLPARIFGRDVPIENVKFAYDVEKNKSILITEQWIKENPGKIVKELAQPYNDNWNIIIDNSRTIETPITEAIPYRTGEYRRIYTDPYFVKLKSNAYTFKDGTNRLIAHRTATTKADAEAYIKAYNEGIRMYKEGTLTATTAAKLMEPWGWNATKFIDEVSALPEDAHMVSVYTRTQDDYIREGINLGYGIAGERGEVAIQNVRGQIETLSPLDSLSAEIANASFVASTVEWRDKHILYWYNTFKEHLPASYQKMSPEDAFFKMVSEKKPHYIGSEKSLLAKQRVEDYILTQLHIPSFDEKMMMGMGRVVSELTEGVFGKVSTKPLPHFIGGMLRNTKDYPSYARTVAFHSFFGFNPVQFLVQGANAVNAIAISPLHGMKAAQVSVLYRLALMSDNERIWESLAKANKVSTLGLGMDTEEFIESVRAIRRTGLLDGINSTSLYGDETGKFGLYNRLWRGAGQTSAFFFNRGEEIARLVSWDIARREWKDANPGKAFFTDEALRKILERQDDLTQNMTIANTAWWQKGILSIPAQFMQYQAKIFLNLSASFGTNGRAFTPGEASRLLTMHLLMMGTAGWWIGDWMREMIGPVVNEWSPETKLYVQQGIFSGLINSTSLAFTGEELKLGIGSRFNTFRFYEELVDGLLDAQTPLLKVLAGASGGAFIRFGDNFAKALSLWTTVPLSKESLEAGATYLLTGAFSAANNYNKAIVASYADAMLSKSGDKLFAVNEKERWFAKWGIPPAAQEDLSVLYSTTKQLNDFVKKESENISRLRTEALIALTNGDTKKHEMLMAAAQIRLEGIPDLHVKNQVRNASLLTPEATKQKRLLRDILINKDMPPRDVLVNSDLSEVR